jgi:hypothetical protein
MERFVYRLATHFRIDDVEAWMQRISLRQVVRWFAYWKVEPFGDDWMRSALTTLYVLKALGANVDEDFIERFLPNYDPDRPMTDDEIKAELTKYANRIHRVS